MTHAPVRSVLLVSWFVAGAVACDGNSVASRLPELCRSCEPVGAGACVRPDGGTARDASPASCLQVLGTYDGTDALGAPTSVLAISVRGSPVDDLALVGSEGRVRLLGIDTGAGTLTKLAEDDAPRDRIFVAWSPDGRFALTASLDVRLLAVARAPYRLTERATYSGHRGSVYAVNFSPNGKYALTAGEDGTARLLGVDGDSGTLTELAVHQMGGSKVYEAAWSPDGKSAWTASQDGTAKWLDVDVGEPAFRERAVIQRDVAVTTIAPSPLGDRVVAGTWIPCPATELWDPGGHSAPALEVLLDHPSGLRAIAWHANGARVFTAGHDDTVNLYAVKTDHLEAIATLRDYVWGVHSLGLSHDGRALLVASSKRDRITMVGLDACR